MNGEIHIGAVLTRTEIQQWLVEARQFGRTDPISLRGKENLWRVVSIFLP